MKKSTKYLIMSGMAIISGISAFAQTPKKCELAVTLITPAANTVYNFGDTVKLKFTIKNNGPAAIVPSDTIYYLTGVTQGIRTIYGSNIASGATVSVDLGSVGTNSSTADQTADVCIALLDQSNIFSSQGTDTTWATVTYEDDVETNNKSCNSVTFKKKTGVGIFDLERNSPVETLSIYPNPASNDVMFDIILEKTEIVTTVVRDMVGRTVIEKDFGKVQAGSSTPFKLDISKLNAGIYFVEVTAGDRQIIGKVTKRN